MSGHLIRLTGLSGHNRIGRVKTEIAGECWTRPENAGEREIPKKASLTWADMPCRPRIPWLERTRNIYAGYVQVPVLGVGMEGDESDAASAFLQEVLHLRDAVGRPSSSRIEAVSKRSLKRSTLDDYFRGKRHHVPEWPFVHELLIACRRIADEDGFPWPSDALGSDTGWFNLWQNARQGRPIGSSPIRIPEQTA